MIYRIMVYTISNNNGQLVHESGALEKELSALSAKLKLRFNKAGTLSFKVAYNNDVFGKSIIPRLKSIVKVFADDNLLWKGRILDIQTDMFKNITVNCEGWLGVLLDSVVRPTLPSDAEEDTITINPGDYFIQLINWHNSMVGSSKSLTPHVDGWSGKSVQIKDSNYETTMDYFQKQFLNNEDIGGRVWVTDNDIYFYADGLETTNSQEIVFGSNLLDFDHFIDSTDIYTCLIPIGKDDLKLGEAGSDYVENANAVNLYGKIFHVETYSDVEDAETLRSKATTDLNKAIENAVTLELTAFDLSLLNSYYSMIKIGSLTRIISPPHGIDSEFICTEAEYDLCNPGNTTFTLGVNPDTLTDRQNKLVKNISGSGRYNTNTKQNTINIPYQIVNGSIRFNSIIFTCTNKNVYLNIDGIAVGARSGPAVNLVTFPDKYAPSSMIKVIGVNVTQSYKDQQFIITSEGRIQVNAQALNIANGDNLTCIISWIHK